MSDHQFIAVDTPSEGVAPDQPRTGPRSATPSPRRCAPSCSRRSAAHDLDPDVRVTVLRGAAATASRPGTTSAATSWPSRRSTPPPVTGNWSRHVTENWFSFWDLAKPVIAQVHGYAIAGATELAQACDLVYVAEDARIGYPIVRVASPPDWQYHMPLLGMRRAMEIMLTGDDLSGTEAVAVGWANKAFPAADLDGEVLAVAERVAGVETDLAQINKRLVHRQADIMGVRAAIRAGSEFQALAGHQRSVEAFKADPLGTMKRHNAADAARRVGAAGPRRSRHVTLDGTLDDADPRTADPPVGPTLTPLKVAIAFGGILLGTTLSGLDASIVATAAPTIIAELGELSLLPWLTTGYLLAQVVTMPVYGKLGDIHGRRAHVHHRHRRVPGRPRPPAGCPTACRCSSASGSCRAWAPAASPDWGWPSSPTSCRPRSSAATSATPASSSPPRACWAPSPAVSSSTTCRGDGRSTSTSPAGWSAWWR